MKPKKINLRKILPDPWTASVEERYESWRKACDLMGVLEKNDNQGEWIDPLYRVRLFDPISHWEWFIIEYNRERDLALCLAHGFAKEWGGLCFRDMAKLERVSLPGIMIDLDFQPTANPSEAWPEMRDLQN